MVLLMVGPHSGFGIPSAEHIFPQLNRNITINRVIFRLGNEFHQFSNMSDQFTTDILSLTFKNESFQEIKVQNTTHDILVWLGNRQTPLNETILVGQYIQTDSATRYLFGVTALKPLHAIQIVLATSSPIFENTTVNMSTELPGNLTDVNDFLFSSIVCFNGRVATIFLPEEEITKAGSYYVTFDLVYSQEAEFRVSTTQHSCSYSVDKAYTWQNGGCKVSPKSDVNSTLCMCNYLTTFTAP
ncbi:polycystin-1-like protein 3 [Ptychodera flava]|uniref:polycystin-1-like protein 3 n=1 Tax=Ptychodera flava TaxID=63121 RepID=UPI00396A97BF